MPLPKRPPSNPGAVRRRVSRVARPPAGCEETAEPALCGEYFRGPGEASVCHPPPPSVFRVIDTWDPAELSAIIRFFERGRWKVNSPLAGHIKVKSYEGSPIQ